MRSLPGAGNLLGTHKFPGSIGEKGQKDMAGNKPPLFPTYPPKKLSKKPPACSQPWARGAPSPPVPRSRGLWIASFCQFFAPYLTAEGRIKQSSQPDLLSSSFLHRKSHSLDALQLNRSEKGVKQHIWEQLQSFQKKNRGFSFQPAGKFPGKSGVQRDTSVLRAALKRFSWKRVKRAKIGGRA